LLLFDSGTPESIVLTDFTVTDDTGPMNPVSTRDIAEDQIGLNFPRDFDYLITPPTWAIEPDALVFDDAGTLDPPYSGDMVTI
jgi:hypothetical protein